VSDGTRELMWNGIGFAFTAGVAVVALLCLWRFVPALSARWLPMQRLRPGKWQGHEVFLAFGIVFLIPLALVALLMRIGFFESLIGSAPPLDPPSDALSKYVERAVNIASPLILFVVLGSLLTVLYARTGTRPHHFGLSWNRWPANTALGLLAFLAATPILLGIFALLRLAFPDQEHKLALLGKQDLEAWEWALLAFQATVAAPLLEEISLRGILQGWLRRSSRTGHIALITLTLLLASKDLVGYDTTTSEVSFNQKMLFPTLFAVLLTGGYGYWMFRLARDFELSPEELRAWQPLSTVPALEWASNLAPEEASEVRRQARERDVLRSHEWMKANAQLAIYGAAMLFAVLHSAWPAPIPLFLFGLVLGWLAYRTQSLIGPIVLHAAFNLVAFIALYGSVLTSPPQNGNAQTVPERPSAVATSVPASQLPLRK
jgi:membrane protease YdiL (CAAX protease family)